MLENIKQQDNKKEQKNTYSKPILIKHKKLTDITAGVQSTT